MSTGKRQAIIPEYRVRARNTSADSENRIHDDAVAKDYGFAGGLVPGITVYAYMTVPVVSHFGMDWLERGFMEVRLLKPVYDGEHLVVHTDLSVPGAVATGPVTAVKDDGTTCATAVASTPSSSRTDSAQLSDYSTAPLPPQETRPPATSESIFPGLVLGTLTERLDLHGEQRRLLQQINEPLTVYLGEGAVAHPMTLLNLANQIVMRNFRLGPWIHAESEVTNFSTARDGEEISVRGRVIDRFERKGHEFAIFDLLMLAGGTRPVVKVRHTAIYRPRTGTDRG